jgi:oligopeptide transport system permease protein
MTEPRDDTDAPGGEKQGSPERTRAADELGALRENWAEREAKFDVAASGEVAGEQRTLLADAARTFMHNKVAVASLAILAIFVLLSIVVPEISDANSTKNRWAEGNQPVSWEHPFGTTPNGKDLWKMAWEGGRISLSIAFAVAMTILIIGVVYGAISGYLGGRTDIAMMRLLDSLYGLPYIPFAILFITLARDLVPGAPPIVYMVPALSLTTWFTAARIMRSQVQTLRGQEFVVSARSMGGTRLRILARHVVPNTIGIMIVAIFLEVPNAILGEATLSFLGLGVQPPDTSWGKLANEGYRYFNSYPKLVWVPGVLIALTVLSTNTIANALRDALDPKSRRR